MRTIGRSILEGRARTIGRSTAVNRYRIVKAYPALSVSDSRRTTVLLDVPFLLVVGSFRRSIGSSNLALVCAQQNERKGFRFNNRIPDVSGIIIKAR